MLSSPRGSIFHHRPGASFSFITLILTSAYPHTLTSSHQHISISAHPHISNPHIPLLISSTAFPTALAVNAIYNKLGLWFPVLVIHAPSVTNTFLQ